MRPILNTHTITNEKLMARRIQQAVSIHLWMSSNRSSCAAARNSLGFRSTQRAVSLITQGRRAQFPRLFTYPIWKLEACKVAGATPIRSMEP